MSTPESPLLIAITDKLAKHQLIRPSDYHDTIMLLKEVPAIRAHAALVEALKDLRFLTRNVSHVRRTESEVQAYLKTMSQVIDKALRQAEEGK